MYSNFKYKNLNPQGYIIPDCSIRAMSNVLNVDYSIVLNKFKTTIPPTNKIIKTLLNIKNCRMIEIKDCSTLNEWLQINSNVTSGRKVLMICKGHCTSIVNGIIEDTFNCGKYPPIAYFIFN